jgi:FkbM family methyltransferase
MSLARQARTLAKAAVNRAVNAGLGRLHPVRMEKLGSSLGGWWIPVDELRSDWICYLAGVGEDITFDLALIDRFGCEVFAFDPTPRAVAHVEQHARHQPKFRFLPYGLWSEEAQLKFYAPKDPNHVSHSVVNLQGTDEFFLANVKPIAKAMEELGHDRIDLLKLDIEGAECPVLRTMAERDIAPRVICAEFDPPKLLGDALGAIRWLSRRYRVVHVDGKNATFMRK